MRGFERYQIKVMVVVFMAAIFMSVQTASAQTEEEPETGRPVGTTDVYGIVVDNSSSFRLMLERVVKTLVAVVENNDDGIQTFLITFIDPSKFIVKQEASRDKTEVADAIENIYAERGRSTLLDALKFSIDHMASLEATHDDVPRLLLIITDGDEKGSTVKADQIIKLAKENKVRLYFIGVSDAKVNTKLLDRLAKETGGSGFYPKTRDELQNMAETISNTLKGRQ